MRGMKNAHKDMVLNENVRKRRLRGIKISALGEGAEFSVFGLTR